jgi:GNAT superfamily N-acetyltransferase
VASSWLLSTCTSADPRYSMTFRIYDPPHDRQALHRLWHSIGWLERGQEESMDVLLSSGRTLLMDLNDQPECLVHSVPGTVCYQDEELALSAVTSVTTSQTVRKQGLAKRLTAAVIAADAAEGALVAGLGMFEQGFYEQLGFGTGGYEHWIRFDPAQLRLEPPSRLPRRITPDDWAAAHALRLRRMRVHGSCCLLNEEVTRSEMMRSKNGFGYGFGDGSNGELTHCFWCSTTEPGFGPYVVHWMAYQTWEQFLELMSILKSFEDQVRLVRMREPPGLQFQDLMKQPFERRRVSEGSKFETGIQAVAYWQMRICNLSECLAKTHLRGGEVRFNLSLSDPIERYLEPGAPWQGISGDCVVTLGPGSTVDSGTDASLCTLKATASAFTRLWLGVAPATTLAVTDDLSGPPELLSRLDEVLLLPSPKWDWDF